MPSLGPERLEAIRSLVARFGLPWREDAAATLDQALTHASYSKENPGELDNERLELLGDSVVTLVVLDRLYAHYPTEQEGALSKRRHALVSRRALGELARGLGLGSLMTVGEGGGSVRTNGNVLGGTLEAFVGALYLHYPWDQIREALIATVYESARVLVASSDFADHKSDLQEFCQARGWGEPVYRTAGQSGTAHAPLIAVEVQAGPEVKARGEGARKRLAEQEAARRALEQLRLAKVENSD